MRDSLEPAGRQDLDVFLADFSRSCVSCTLTIVSIGPELGV